MKLKYTSRLAFPLASAIAALLASSSVHAGQIWDGTGGDNNWNTAGNWDGDALPIFTDVITFVGNTRNGAVNNLTADAINGGINLTNDGTSGKTNAFTLSGNRITLGGDITTTASSAAITDTISLAMILDGNRTIATNTNHNLIIGGIISETGGARNLIKNGAGTLRFDSINSYSGSTTINAGTIEVRAGTAGGSAVWGAGGINLGQGASLYFNPANQAVQNTSGFAVSSAITLGGGAGTANIRFAGNDNKFALSGGVTGQAGVAQTLAITQGAAITNGDRQNILFSGAIADGSGGTLGVSVDFAGASSASQSAFVNLSGQNTFTGNLSVTNSKGLNAGSPNVGAWLTIGGERWNSFSVGSLAAVGTGFLGAGADYSGNISISNGTGGLTTLGFLTSANQILRGIISGTGALHQGGSGSLTLTNANTFTGGTTVAAGSLLLATGGSLADTGAMTVSGGTFNIQTVSDTIGTLTLSGGTVTGSTGVLSASSYAIRSGTASAILGGSGSLTKSTAGSATLSGANTFSGSTTVSAGTLTLDYATQDNSKLSDSAALVLGGGTVSLSGGTHTEVVASTTLQAGTTSNITRPSGTSVLQLGTISVNPGSFLVLGAAGIATTNNTNDSLGVLGTWATIAGSGWAVNSTNGANGLITAATYTDVTRLSSGTKTIASDPGNIRIIEGTGSVGDVTMAAAGTTSINTLVNTATTAGTVAVGTGNTLSTGAILQSSGAGTLTIGTFGATAGSLRALSAGGNLALVANSTNGVIIHSVIADNSTSTLTKDGSGTVTLTGANTYAGGTTISAGVLAVGLNNGGVGGDNINPDGTSTSLGSGAVNVAAGASLQINTAGLTIANNITLNGLSYGVNSGGPTATNAGFWNGALMGNSKTGVTSNTFSGTITLNATSNVSTNWNDKTMIITGKVTGAGGLVIDNSAPANRRGSLVRLDNTTNDYAGDTTVNNGNTMSGGIYQPTLILGASNVIPDGANKGNLIVLGNLNLNGFSDTVNGLSGSGTITSGVAGTPTLTVGNNDATGFTYSGIIQNGSGTVALVKTGSGTQTLSGINTHTGGTTVNGGTLALAAVGSSAGYIRGTLTINSGGIVTPLFSGTGWGLGFGSGTSVNTINIDGGQLLFTGTAGNGGTAASTINMTAGTIGGSGGNTFDWYFGNTTTPFLNTLASANTATVSANLNLRLNGNANALTFNVADGAAATDLLVSGNVIASGSGDGTGRIVKSGAGTLTLSGTNTYTAGTTISAGTLNVANVRGLGASGTLSINAASTTRLSTDTAFGGSNPVYNVSMTSPGSYRGTIELNRATAGAVTGITHNFGTLTLSLNGGQAGGLNVTAGTNAPTGGALDTIAFTSFNTGNNNTVTQTLNPTGGNITIGTLTAAGNQPVTVALSGTTAGNAITGAIGGTGNQNLVAITKTNSSTWTLSGANSYTGATNVDGGKLLINGSTSTSSAVSVNGGTLGGNGTIGGSVTVQANGTFAPGNSIDSIATGNLALLASSTYAQEVNKFADLGVSGDLTVVTGSLSITALANLTLTEIGTSGAWDGGDKITLIGYSTGTWNGGLFTYLGNTLADDSTINFSGTDWTFNYDDTAPGDNYQSDMAAFTGSARYVTMTAAIPEPSSLALLGLGSLLLLRRRR